MEVSLVLVGSVLAASDDGFPAPTKQVFQPPHWFDVDLGPIHFYMNKATALVLFAAAFVGVLFWLGFRKATIVPRPLQNFCESVYDFVDLQVSRDIIGEKGRKYTPYFVVLFCFVLVCNLLSIVPIAQFPATSRIAIPMILSVITFVIFNYAGIRANGPGRYFKEMVDPAPTAPMFIRLLLGPIEIVSTLLVRPFTLAVRLFANMFAGHMLLLIFSIGAKYLLERPPYVFGAVSLLVSIILTGFELVIDLLQAYIITVLTAAYIAGAIEHGDEEHETGEPAARHISTASTTAPVPAGAQG
jgi:F-type H+-transporting ATPase subunit a